jgi:succinoglycan biosynthesis protein ExoL
LVSVDRRYDGAKMAANTIEGREFHATLGGGRQLIFFSPDISDTSTIKRAQEFLDQGYALTVLGFRRDRYNQNYTPTWPNVFLGYTQDGRYGQRASAMLLAARVILRHRRRLRSAAVVYARNIDQLVLAVLARAFFCRRACLAYEMLDIPPIHVGRGIASIVLRAIERFCLRRVGVLVLSSPAFLENYFVPWQRYRGAWFLLENKVHPRMSSQARGSVLASGARAAKRAPYRWVVGYFGLIRGEETFELMTRLAARLEGTVLFKFRGVLTTVDEQRFAAALARHPNIVYDGDYTSPDDLRRIYTEVDFAWALDLEHVAHNSRWLRPCRFYEGGLYGVPCLAVRDFEIGRLIDELDIGWTFSIPLEDALVRFFERLSEAEYARKRARLLALPVRTFVADGDISALCDILEKSSRAAAHSSERQNHRSDEVVPVGGEAAHVVEEKRQLVGHKKRQAVERAGMR